MLLLLQFTTKRCIDNIKDLLKKNAKHNLRTLNKTLRQTSNNSTITILPAFEILYLIQGKIIAKIIVKCNILFQIFWKSTLDLSLSTAALKWVVCHLFHSAGGADCNTVSSKINFEFQTLQLKLQDNILVVDLTHPSQHNSWLSNPASLSSRNYVAIQLMSNNRYVLRKKCMAPESCFSFNKIILMLLSPKEYS